MINSADRLRGDPASAGLMFSLVANAVWAAQPLYWPLVDDSGPVELLAHRVVWSAVVCLAVVLAVPRRRMRLAALSRHPRRLGLLTVASACLASAWGVYIYAVTSGHVVEGSLGLFMVPLTTVLSGVAVFGERLRAAQTVALGAAAAATAVLTVGYGRLPWIALSLSGLMAVYATLKKKAGAPALEGFTAECLAMVPAAIGYIVFMFLTGDESVVTSAPEHTALVAASGLITAVPLLGHAASLHRLPLATVGVLQYINPTAQFLIGVLVRHEDMSPTRWGGFALVWTAVLVFVLSGRRPRDGGHGSPRDRPSSAASATS